MLEQTWEEISSVLDETAAAVLAEASIAEPPIDALHIAQNLGFTVAVNRQQLNRAHIAHLGSSGASTEQEMIVVRPESRPERLQWAVAHEIGETFAGKVLYRLGVRLLEVALATREQIANCLASRLLLPHEWFERDAKQVQWDLLQLKARYATASHELIARRMLDFAPAIIITIIDNGEISSRQSNVPGRIPPLSTVERQALQRVADQAVSYRVIDRHYNVQAWLVHEPYWRREILRTELCVDCLSGTDPYWE